MSLSIDAFVRDPNTGERQYLDAAHPPQKQMAGFERYRRDFWGAEVMKSLGLTLLPLLKEQYGVEVDGNGLDELEREVQTIWENVELVSENTHLTPENIRFYVENVLDAIRVAKDAQGGVIIW